MNHRRLIATAMAPLCAGLALAASPSYAGHHLTKHPTKSTSFAFKSTGYGSRIIGGQLPVGSATTGFKAIGCTTRAGLSRTNNVVSAALPGLGTANGIKTHVWTTSRHGAVASHSVHTIARVALVQSGLGTLSLDAVRARSTALHNASGFHATTTTTLGGISFTPVVGPEVTFPAPTPDQPLTIPGLATIYAGEHSTKESGNGAVADSYALRVEMIPTGTSIRIARSHAELYSGMTGGVFKGHSAATHVVTALGDIVKSGPNPLTPMPCQGTYGKTHEKSLASIDLGGQLVVKGATSAETGNQKGDRAWGVSRAEVARVSLGGQLVIDGVVGKVSVSRHNGHLTRSAKGTVLGRVTVAGQAQKFPKTGVLEIPGLAKLERGVVTRSHHGISVIGLRITLLDGSGAVIDLGEASLGIGRLAH
jgi:hypothetical protein